MRFKWLAAVAALAFIGRPTPRMPRPALVYDLGGKFDKSFNEAAYNGAERSRRRPASNIASSRSRTNSQREQAFRNFARAAIQPDHRP